MLIATTTISAVVFIVVVDRTLSVGCIFVIVLTPAMHMVLLMGIVLFIRTIVIVAMIGMSLRVCRILPSSLRLARPRHNAGVALRYMIWRQGYLCGVAFHVLMRAGQVGAFWTLAAALSNRATRLSETG